MSLCHVLLRLDGEMSGQSFKIKLDEKRFSLQSQFDPV